MNTTLIDSFGRQAITTQYFGPTNVRGSRVKATAQAGSVTLSWSHEKNIDENHEAAAHALAAKFNWTGHLARGYLRDGSHVFVFVSAPKPAVRFIVETYANASRSGFIQRWARITSTVSGRTLNVQHVGGAQNIPSEVYKALDPQRPRDFDVWSWIHYTEQDVSRRQFSPPENAILEGELTADMVLALEEPKR